MLGIVKFLQLPELEQAKDLNNPFTVEIHRQIIRKKPFLRKLYLDLYKEFKRSIKNIPDGPLVEIGSGAGFIKEVIPNVITSDVVKVKDIEMVFSATNIPFEDVSVSAFFLLDVFHHIQDPKAFFSEASRCLVNKGKIVMIEPFNSLFGSFIYKNFHHEPFDVKADWGLVKEERMTSSNHAMPWIIFYRDRKLFESRFPKLKIKRLQPHTPFCYLLSGGFSIKQLVPSFMYNLVKGLEKVLSPLNSYLGCFLTVELEKTE